MGNTNEPPLPPRNPVPEGKIRICVAGYSQSPHFSRALHVADEIGKANPQYETWFYGPSRDKYLEWLADWKNKENVADQWKQHNTSPICWFEKPGGEPIEIVGGRDRLCEWTSKNLPGSAAAQLGESSLFAPFEYFGDAPKQTAT